MTNEKNLIDINIKDTETVEFSNDVTETSDTAGLTEKANGENVKSVDEIKRIVEALLMAANDPLSIDYLHKLLAKNEIAIDRSEVRKAIDLLQQDYQTKKSAVQLKEVASGYRFQVGDDLAIWVKKLWEEKPPCYSRAFLETLAIITYKQPTTRAEIEEIRGVSVSSNIIKTLKEHGWIKIIGYKEVPGKPALYATTAKFLDYFNLKSLEELPIMETP